MAKADLWKQRGADVIIDTGDTGPDKIRKEVSV
jgi:hypothetical protein